MAFPETRHRQAGAISAIAVVALGLALTLAALSVDLGYVFWVKRDLQKAADLAALSAVTDLSNANTVARQIALANGFNPDTAGNTLTVTPGVYDEDRRSFSAGGVADAQNAAQVTVSTTVPYFFLLGSHVVQATGMAARQPIAGFFLGSFLARIGSTDPNLLNGTLGGLLGGPLSLDVLSYQGLAAANVSLLGLSAGLGLGTVDELLAANVTLGQLLDAAISALNAQGNSSAALSLGSLRAAVSATLPPIAVGDLLKVEAGNPESAATAQVNALQLVTLAAQIANVNSGSLISTGLALNIPGVASVSLALATVDKPSIAIGPAKQDGTGAWVTRAHAAQIRLRLRLTLLGAVSGGVVNLPLYIEGGGADASLTGIQCKVPKDSSVVTIQTQPQVLAAYIGNVSDAAMQNHSAPVTVTKAALLNLLLVRVDGYAKVPLQGAGETLQFNGPFDYNNTQTVAGSGLGLGGLLNSNLVLTPVLLGLPLPLPLGGILSALTGLLGAVLGPVLDGLLLDPILSLLGIQLGGSDVTAFYLNCGTARLVQ